MFFLRKAIETDRNWINTCNLGVSRENIINMDDYFILQSVIDQKPIGMLALEMYSDVAYLHSLRFTNGAPAIDKLGKLFDYLMSYCHKQGTKQLYLVAPSTSSWMLELGFEKCNDVPIDLQKSAHYHQVSSNGILLSYPLHA
ncbi:hypothetical protein [Shimazuella kribbensis]|uniref:hypothetical protein n=1 Tax=Shimazuella kribbensis TaxID=139808 RepID=UPI0004071508|nr:hypothetical protein [Shimazuella kribbensis]